MKDSGGAAQALFEYMQDGEYGLSDETYRGQTATFEKILRIHKVVLSRGCRVVGAAGHVGAIRLGCRRRRERILCNR